METRYKILTTHDEVKKLVKCCKRTRYCCFDFETNASPIYNSTFKPTIISISYMPGFGCSIPLDHHQALDYCEEGWDWKKELRYIGKKLISNPKIVKVGWNLKFDNQIMELYDIYYRGVALDGMLAKYILNELRPNGLKDMVRRYLPEYGNYEKQDKFDKIPWDQKPLKELCKYGCQDTDYTLRLTIFFEKKLIDKGLYSLYRNLIMTASRVLTSVEKNGLYVDRKFNYELLTSYKPMIDKAQEICLSLPKVKKFQKKLQEQRIEAYLNKLQEEIDLLDGNNPADKRKIASREQKISNIKAGVFTTKTEKDLVREINLGSPIDLPQLLYGDDGFKFEVLKQSDKGKPSTDEETLVKLRINIKNPESPKAIFLDNLLKLRGLQKMYTTYIEGWHDKVQDDNCLHGKFNIIGTESGRLCIARGSSIITDKGLLNIEDICPDNIGIKPVKNLKALTHTGKYQDIKFGINKGKEMMYKVTLENGNTITCTLNHRLLTNHGWKSLKDIDVELDTIECYEQDKKYKEVGYKEGL